MSVNKDKQTTVKQQTIPLEQPFNKPTSIKEPFPTNQPSRPGKPARQQPQLNSVSGGEFSLELQWFSSTTFHNTAAPHQREKSNLNINYHAQGQNNRQKSNLVY